METEHSRQLFARSQAKQLSSRLVADSAYETPEDTLDLGQPLAILRRRIRIVAGVAIGIAVVLVPVAFWFGSRKPPQYAGSFQILVEPVTAEDQYQRLVLTPQQGPGESTSLQTGPTGLDYNTQIQILQSPKLIQPVLQQVQTKYPNISYKQLASNLTIQRLGPGKLSSKPSGASTKLLQVTYQDSDPGLTEFVLKQLANTYLKYSLQERQSSISQGVKFIDAQLPALRQRVNELQGQLQEFRQRFTIIDPDNQGQVASSQSGNLDQQNIDTETKLAEARSRYSTLQRQSAKANDMIVLAEAPQYGALLSKYEDIQSQIALESARSREGNPTLQALRERQQNLQALLRQEAQRVLGKSVDDVEILESRNQAILRAKGQADEKIRQYPALARRYTDIQRDLKLATNSLDEFQTKREALQIDAAQKEVPWELLSPPEIAKDSTGEPVDVGSNLALNLMVLAAFVSLMAGVGAGFLADSQSNTYHAAKEFNKTAKLPLLGVIPLDEGKAAAEPVRSFKLPFIKRRRKAKAKQISDTQHPKEFTANESVPSEGSDLLLSPSPLFVEAFRSLYKNLRLLKGLSAPIRSLTISSPEPGDGKSTIAVNLAQAAAAMGKRVLLVDADLRHPQVHSQMNLSNECGLSDILTSNVNVRNALQQSPLKENLMVLTAGQTAVDPVELLSSGKMQLLMERFQMVFDLVIYDTPPLLGLADGSLLAAQTNGLVLVVRMGKTKRPALTQTLEELKISSTTVLGLVANGSKEAARTPYGYYRPYVQSQNGAAPAEV